MSCCGQARQPFRTTAQVIRKPAGLPSWPAPAVLGESVSFEYTGDSTLTAVGSITRRVYRFRGPGAVLQVDPRDAPGIRAVPRLRAMRSRR